MNVNILHHDNHRHLCDVVVDHLLLDLVDEVVAKSCSVIRNSKLWLWPLGIVR